MYISNKFLFVLYQYLNYMTNCFCLCFFFHYHCFIVSYMYVLQVFSPPCIIHNLSKKGRETFTSNVHDTCFGLMNDS